MRHYEIVAVVHPDQQGRISAMIDLYKKIVTEQGGVVHRLENWGRRPLTYPIQNQYKAQYLLLNVECDNDTLDKLRETFRFSDSILRSLIIRREQAITEPSVMMQEKPISEEQPVNDRGDRGRENTREGASRNVVREIPSVKIPSAEEIPNVEEDSDGDSEEDDADTVDKAAGADLPVPDLPSGSSDEVEGEKKSAKGTKVTKADKSDKVVKADKDDKSAAADKVEKADKADKPAKAEKVVKADKEDKQSDKAETDKADSSPSAAVEKSATADKKQTATAKKQAAAADKSDGATEEKQ